MGALDIIFGPTKKDLAKKKEKKPEPTPSAPPPVASKGKEKPKAAAAAAATSGPNQPVPKSVGYPTANTPRLSLDGLEGLLKPQDPIDPDLLKDAAAHLLGMTDYEGPRSLLPEFDISDLEGQRSKIEEILASTDMPINLRPLAAHMDTVYGTNRYAKTPNQRADFMGELQQLKALTGDSAALQQVKGQGRLEKYKAQLKQHNMENGVMSPVEKAEAYERLSKALRGSSPEQIALLRARIDALKINSENAQQDAAR